MATGNFRTQDNFPLFASKHFDGFYETDEETGEEIFFDGDPLEIKFCEKRIDQLNDSLNFYKLSLESGYYNGVQCVLEEKDGAELSDYYTPEEWRERRKEKNAYPYYYYYNDYAFSYSQQKREEQREIRKIINFCRTILKDEFEFDEYVVTARFSNGETWYGLASEQRAKMKAAAVA